MAKDIVVSASLVPVSELLSETFLAMSDTIHAAKEVLIQKENFKVFSRYLEKTSSILKELSKQNIECSESLTNALKILNREVDVAKQLALDCGKRNKVYLLINCRKIVESLESCTKEIGRALSLIPLASLDVSSGINSQISKLFKNMLDGEYRATVEEEEILAKFELGIQEQNADRSYANNLLVHIAEALGISNDQSAWEKEFEEFKRELDDTNTRKDLEENLHMEQIIALLQKANATTSAEDKENDYFEKRNSVGRLPLEPFDRFFCPVTREIMVDPVEISSHCTFERSVIEKWFAEGKNHCPVTDIPLDTSVLLPNKALKRSIEEWKDRKTIFMITSIKPKLQSNEEQEVLQSLDKLQNLCTERELHREWVTLEDYIPVLVRLLLSKNREIRKHALAILSILAKDGEETKGRIIKVDNALESIVHSLARHIGERKLALQLLLELSKSRAARDLMGNVQGCILLLVTMLSNEDNEVIRDANVLLENLSFVDQNVIHMAKANYFKPLLKLLSSGPQDVKVLMAGTLSEIELTDHNKLSIVKDGALGPLLQLLSHSDLEKRKVGVKALLHLSKLSQNGLQMIREGAVGPLFELLYCHSLLSPTLREQVAETIMHLAISTTTEEAAREQVSLLDSEEEIFKLFSLISLTGPDIQRSILKTFHAMCQSSSGSDIRRKLRQLSAVQVLVQLCEADNPAVRANAMKLFFCLTEDGGDDTTFLEHVSQRCIEALLRIITSSTDVGEIAAAMGIIANLPKDPDMTGCLLDAEALQIICSCLSDGNRDASYRRQVIENAVGALCRFTVPTNQEWQRKVAEAGIIPVLVQLLASGTPLTKQNAAISLKQLSQSSKSLSKPIKKPGFCLCCLSAPESGCPAHLGICTVESSFCMVKANALEPLVRLLGEADVGACEASLDALLTLIDDQEQGQGGKVLDEAKAVGPIVKLLSSQSARLQGKSLMALERIFQVNELFLKYGASAHMALVDITQKKNSDMKSLAAKLLAQLGVLGTQSSYF
ncbi:PREDICTED: U-box domain-containing protein 43-like [Prunus mume]|uniref:RING-type E3 ubiquitin transferase n=1 Tax=Prunus mume TaxID=102107 RepID=A0ABM1LS82_PRUMU|nr:PREDICTED: U-box domain-containing protein 43-like [Prunus mume]XP_016650257.1 PREDICTED: U-box domain-containing protein 43-like [Prunus mume]XP_016650258.1 PREDICTED: U-box domain-containing protein 43-like [Prunus mume]XP_016650259.1 PREDICTED: U-box domain-containing protein 43-like [Prunus mume]